MDCTSASADAATALGNWVKRCYPIALLHGGPTVNATVTLSSKYQIVIPQAAREALSLSSNFLGRECRVLNDAQAALLGEVWQGADAYLKSERDDW